METLISAPISASPAVAGQVHCSADRSYVDSSDQSHCSMIITIYAIGVDTLIFDDGGFSPLFVLQILGVLFVFASFFSSVLLGVTSFARSFKEA
ncbi:MAG: hypothetical protein R3C11_07550 [Planctomycetaceae bacterium]